MQLQCFVFFFLKLQYCALPFVGGNINGVWISGYLCCCYSNYNNSHFLCYFLTCTFWGVVKTLFHHGGSYTKHTYKSKHKEHKTQHKHTVKIVKREKKFQLLIAFYERGFYRQMPFLLSSQQIHSSELV